MGSDRARTVQDAERFMKSGKIGDAISVYRKIADDNPRDLNTTNKLGDLLVKAGKNQEAMRYFLRIAEYYAKDGFYLKAIAMYKKMTKIDASSLDFQVRLADLYHEQGLAIEAKAQYLLVAEHFVKAGNFARAIEVLPKVVELEPENLKVRMMLADLLGRTGKHNEAATEYAGIVEVLHRGGSADEAVKIARRGLKASPASGAVIARLLVILRSQERPTKDLLALAEETSAGHGRSPRALALLGEARRRAGRQADAEEVLEGLAALDELQDETLPEVMEVVARHHASQQRVDDAYGFLSKAVREYRRAARHAEAESLLDEFLDTFPDHGGALSLRSESPPQEAPGGRSVSRPGSADMPSDVDGETAAPPDRAARPSVAAPRPKPAPPKPAAPPARSASPASARSAEVEGLQGLDDLDLVIEEDRPGNEAMDSEPGPPVPVRPASPVAKGATAAAKPAKAAGPSPRTAPRSPAAAPIRAVSQDEPPGDEEEYVSGSKIQEIQAVDEDGEPEDEDFITEHLTEADVFVKYGLLDKAKQQLTAVLSKYPRHVASRTRLKEIYCEEGNKDMAVEECLRLAEIIRAQGSDEEARDLVNEAVRIDPRNERIARFNSGATEPEPEPARPRKGARAAAAVATAEELEPEPSPEPMMRGEAEEGSDSEVEIEIEEASQDVGRKARVAKRAQPVEKIEEETPDDLGSGSVSDPAETEMDFGAVDSASDEQIEQMMGNAPPTDPDSEKLGEVDFYIDQGLLDEAREVIAQLRKQFPKSEEVSRRATRVAQAESEAPEPQPEPSAEEPSGVDLEVERVFGTQSKKVNPPKAPTAPPKAPAAPPKAAAAPRASKPAAIFKMESAREDDTGDFIDLASELSQSLAEAQRAVSDQEQQALEGPGHTLAEIFKAFKQGVEQQVGSEDYDTHYNLGIAYKEMGLVDEAIGEFQFAARDPARLVECCGILGLCFLDKGMPELALKWYRKGLDMPNVGEHEAIGLRYDIAEVYQQQGDRKSALKFYTEVFGMDSTYRDVAAKIRDLKTQKS